MEEMAGIPSCSRYASVLNDRSSVAYSRGPAQSGILLVLLRQRASIALSGQTISKGLQQAPSDRLLEFASRLALSLEFVPCASRRKSARACETASPFRVELRRSYTHDLPGLVGADPRVFCDFNQSGVLHVSRLPAAAAASGRCAGF